MEKFSHDEYIRLIGEGKNLGDKPEERYKDSFIPLTLYKYWSFSSQYIDENLKKLCDGKIWMPIANTLNDPFEFQILSDRLTEEKKLEFRVDTLGRNSILSLCDSYDNNLLWSHYGWSHSGICIEFEVEDKRHIFPVTYCQEQIDATEDIEQWLCIKTKVIAKLISKQLDELNVDERRISERVQKIMFYKHCDWEYENEFRIIGRNNPNDPEEDGGWFIKPGFWAECRSYGLKVKQIILGFNCSLQNKARVMEIVNKHNHDVLMARMVEYDFRFPMSKFIKNISEEGDFISIAQMVRIKESFKLERQELDKTDTWIYK